MNHAPLPRDTEVLVVGAGPTGLTAATALAQLGVDVTVVDIADGPRGGSRAAGVQPRTVEDLARIGVADVLLSKGLRGKGFRAATRDRTLLDLDYGRLDTPYPYVLLVPQDVTEAVLEDHLEAAGVRVHREHRVLAIDAEFDAVTVDVADPDGVVRCVRARYVVAADGLHSGIRGRAGIEFAGTDRAQHYALATTGLDGLDEDPRVLFTLSPAGLLLVSPLPGGQYRVVATTAPGATGFGRDDLQRLVDERVPRALRLRVRDVHDAGPYTVTERMAATFRQDRVFLAGDAAHVHSPAGGQGMNTGIQDAVNLAWKLAAVLRDDAPDTLLDSYDRERRANARALLQFTSLLTTISTIDDPTVAGVRDTVLHAVGGDDDGRALAVGRLSQLAVGYPTPGSDPRVGRRVPPSGDWARSLHWALLLPDGADASHLPADVPTGVSPWDDAVLVRPDGYVAAVAPPDRDGVSALWERRIS